MSYEITMLFEWENTTVELFYFLRRAMNHESLLNTNAMVCKWANVAYYTAYKV